MSNDDPEDALSALIIDECHYIEQLVDKAAAEMGALHLNEAHEAILLARRRYDSLLGKTSANDQGSQKAFLTMLLQNTRQSIEKIERRLAAHMDRKS